MSKFTTPKEPNIHYTVDEINNRLAHPLYRLYDKYAKVYRFYSSEDDYNTATEELAAGSLSAEMILAEEFEITAPAPYTCTIMNYTDGVNILEGATGTYLNFDFQTVDGNGVVLNEWVDISITFTNNGVSQQASVVSNGSIASGQTTIVHFLADDYLKSGVNSITLIAKGRTSGVSSSPVVLTYTVVSIGISSTFDVAQSRTPSLSGATDIEIPFHTWGAYDKYVECYLDSEIQESLTTLISASNDMTEATSVLRYITLSTTLNAGKHNLQLRTRVTVSGSTFYSKTLYMEFVVTGANQTQVTMFVTLDSGEIISATNPLVLSAEQYKEFSAVWGYYSNSASDHTGTISWQLANESGTTTISTTEATVIDATNDKAPDPLVQTFEIYGVYTLQAVKGDEVIASYTINIVKNQDGIEKYTNGLRLELSAVSRSNTEPSALRKVWQYGDFSTTFNGVQWNSVSGWIDKALCLRDGATATIDINPFVSPQDTGATVEITFETFSVSDETAPVIYCDNGSGGRFNIYGNKAEMKSRQGADIDTEFQTDTKMTLAFVINQSSASGASTDSDLMFIQTNGVRERSESYAGDTDTFNSSDVLHLGDPTGKAGVKIYSIRIYNRAMDRNSAANNYIIGTSSISALVDDNDIMTNGVIDIDKLKAKYDTIGITADISQFFNSTSKDTLYGTAWRENPQDPTVNFTAVGVAIGHPGQSTMGFSKPQLRLNFNSKKAVVLYDANGDIVDKGWYAINAGAIKEKKVRLNPNFVDSTCANAGGFFNMVNDVYQKTQINSEFVLLNAAQKYAKNTYPGVVGQNFPYEIQSVPRATPVVVIWRPTENDDWSFLSVFALLDEKKSPYKFGQHSIYDKVVDGVADPFDQGSGSKGNKLWDNENCAQYEIQDNGEALALFKDMTYFWDSETGLVDEKVFEREYPDADDYKYDEDDKKADSSVVVGEWKEGGKETVKAYDDKFYRLASWICACKDDQTKFDNEWLSYLEPYKTAAYYVLMMKLGMVDSSVRNMDIRTDDGVIWYPIWWDPDVQKGKRNDGPLVFSPRIDRDSLDPQNNANYAYAGHDSVFLNLLEGCTAFMSNYVPKVNQGMYEAGLTSTAMMDYYHKFTEYFCIRLYNESIQEKYIGEFPGHDYLDFNAGNGENHDLWWVADNFQYWDARWSSASYAARMIYTRVQGAYGKYSSKAVDGKGCTLYFKTAKEQYYMYAQTNLDYRQLPSAIHASPDDENEGAFSIELGAAGASYAQDFGVNNPIVVYGVQSLKEVDYHEVARYFSATLQLDGLYDENLGTNCTKLILGISKTDMGNGVFNTDTTIAFSGLNNLTILEYFDVQGLRGLSSFATGSFDQLDSLKTFLAAGSGLTALAPHSGLSLELMELPDTLTSLTMTDSKWDTLTFYRPDGVTAYTTDSEDYAAVPTTMERIYFYNMGEDDNVRRFVLGWLHALDDADADMSLRYLTLTNLLWYDVDYDDILLLSKIPHGDGGTQRVITGYIRCNTTLTTEQMDELMNAFDDENLFTGYGTLTIDCAAETFVVSVTGDRYTSGGNFYLKEGGKAQLGAVAFPVQVGSHSLEYSILGCDIDAATKTFVKNSVTLNARTGEITVAESGRSSYSVTFLVTEVGETTREGQVTITIVPLTYPTSVQIQRYMGEEQENVVPDANNAFNITSSGIFYFRPKFSPEYTGSRSSASWTQGWTDNANYSKGTPTISAEDEFALVVSEVPTDETLESLAYEAIFKNYPVVAAGKMSTSVVLRLFQVIAAVVRNTTAGNIPLYTYLYGTLGVGSGGSVSSLQAKDVIAIDMTGNNDIVKLNGQGTDQLDYNALQYMSNIESLVLKNCTNFVGSVMANGLKYLATIDLTGTNIKVVDGTSNGIIRLENLPLLNTLTLGNVGSIAVYEVTNCPQLPAFARLSEIIAGQSTLVLSTTVNQQSITEAVNYGILANINKLSSDNVMTGTVASQYIDVQVKEGLADKQPSLTIVSESGSGEPATIVEFADPVVASAWKTNVFGVGETDVIPLADVKALSNVSADQLNLHNDTRVKTFDELQYFEGLFYNVNTNQGLLSGASNLSSVMLPSNATIIPSSFFGGCSSITSIELPETITEIGYGAFSTTGLKSITLPNIIKKLDNSCFFRCESLEYINLPEGLETIGYQCFLGDSKLVIDRIPSTVTNLEQYAFSGCSSIGNLEIACNITEIKNNAFGGCGNLDLPKGIPESVTVIGSGAFGMDGLTITSLPSKLVSLGSSAFYACRKMNIQSLPTTLTSIGDSAFAYCSGMSAKFDLSNLVSIGKYAFKQCEGLDAENWPESITEVPEQCFYGCVLSSMTCEEGGCLDKVTTINRYSFSDTKIAWTRLPSSLKIIGERAFSGCKNLEISSIPSSVESLGEYCFCNCDSLAIDDISNLVNITEIPNGTFEAGDGVIRNHHITAFPPNLQKIGDWAFRDYYKGMDEPIDLILPNSVANIGASCFYECESLRSVKREDGTAPEYDYTGDGLFYSCNNLTSIGMKSLPSDVEELGRSTFSYCTKLEMNGLPSSLKKLGSSALNYCYNWNLDGLPEGIECVEPNALSYVGYKILNSEGKHTIQITSIPESITASNWGYDSDSANEYGVINGVYVSINTVPSNWTFIPAGAFRGSVNIADTFELKEGITEVHKGAFRGMGRNEYGGNTEIQMNEGLVSIGDYAFADRSRATKYVIPSTVTTIGSMAFSGNSSLTSMYFRGTTPPSIEGNSIPSGVNAYVPTGCAEAYNSAWGSKFSGTITEMAVSDMPEY